MPHAIPAATYRLQLSAAFGFDAAAALVPYLKALGISHLYASPFLKARAGSTHGYDIVDHAALNPEFGGDEAFARLSSALAAADMGLILDFVPNHMGIGQADNSWWLDVLEWGEDSPYAKSFDIEWDLLPYRRGGGVLLPILGRPYGDALEQGEIELRYDAAEGSFSAWYYEHRLPIAPPRYGEILKTVIGAAGAENHAASQRMLELAGRHRGPRSPSREAAPEFKAALAAIPGATELINRGLDAFRPNGTDPVRVLALHRLLERQHYRLAHWRVATSEINYRRFFDINDLAGIRVEDPATFRAVHTLVLRLIGERRLHGLRLDHIDGLGDPAGYCRRLQQQIRAASGTAGFYTVVEKILADGEAMPRLPGVAGTTGYEWLNTISRVLVQDSGLPELDALWRTIGGNDRSFARMLERAKLRVLETLLASEFTVLSRLLGRIAAGHFSTRDFTADRLRAAMQLYILAFPVYRTYVSASGASAEDRALIERTIERARTQWFGPDAAIFDLLRDILTLDLVAPGRTGYSKARVRRFVRKLQQFTGPMMAKSLEDTAFYRYLRLLALNEVGGAPAADGLTAAQFHARMHARSKTMPHGLTATATHDTKRGEDARMRVLALAELIEPWRDAVSEWRELNAPLVSAAGDRRQPTAAHEYMIYQTLVGAWPLSGPETAFAGRMRAYAIKAAREGKVETSWTNPDLNYEAALERFVTGLFDARRSPRFLESFAAFARRPALLGALNSLSQLVLKATLPGVPDFYQGTEFWDLSLVDPDNRRPVDFAARFAALETLGSVPDWAALTRTWPDGRIKLALTRRLLALRQEFAGLFRDGGYVPIEVAGPDREHIVSFARMDGRNAVIVAVGRHFASVTGSGVHWPMEWKAELGLADFASVRNALNPAQPTESDVGSVGALFAPLPVAVLSAVPRRSRAAAHSESVDGVALS